jgi:pimeloyl-ACP methyl ester carboxylesterase
MSEAEALLVIHDVGDTEAGFAWQRLVEAWPGPAWAPDLPGHAETPPPTGAAYALPDAAVYAWRAVKDAGIIGDGNDVVVLGHRSAGFAAELLAAGGRASRLILVDGLGPPWLTVDEIVVGQQKFMRGLFEDPAALAPSTTVPDPRLAHGFAPIWERGFIRNLRRSITVPVLAVETPASPTSADERAERLEDYAGPADLVEVEARDAAAVTSALGAAAWLQP